MILWLDEWKMSCHMEDKIAFKFPLYIFLICRYVGVASSRIKRHKASFTRVTLLSGVRRHRDTTSAVVNQCRVKHRCCRQIALLSHKLVCGRWFSGALSLRTKQWESLYRVRFSCIVCILSLHLDVNHFWD